MSTTPAARLSEKKACPMAFRQVSMVTLLKSGLNRKLTPAAAPGRVTERITIITISSSSTGIIHLVVRSIPLVTPSLTTRAVHRMNMIW